MEIEVRHITQGSLTLKNINFEIASLLARDISKDKPFLSIHNILKAVSNIDKLSLQEISIQEAISIVVAYRMMSFNNHPMTSDASPLYPADFLIEYDDNYVRDGQLVSIESRDYGRVRFNPYITLANAIKAERDALIAQKTEMLGLFVLGAGCIFESSTKSNVVIGREVLLNMEYSDENIASLNTLNLLLSSVSNIEISLFQGINDMRVLIAARKEGGSYVIPFRGSALCTI